MYDNFPKIRRKIGDSTTQTAIYMIMLKHYLISGTDLTSSSSVPKNNINVKI